MPHYHPFNPSLQMSRFLDSPFWDLLREVMRVATRDACPCRRVHLVL